MLYHTLRLFSLGNVTSKVYTAKPATIDDLEANIEHVIDQIPVEMLGRVIENCDFRMNHVGRSYGQHLKDIIFKKKKWSIIVFCTIVKIIQ